MVLKKMKSTENFDWVIYDKKIYRKKMIFPFFIVITTLFASFFTLYLFIDFLLMKQDLVRSLISFLVFFASSIGCKYFYNDFKSNNQDFSYFILFIPINHQNRQLLISELEQMLKLKRMKYNKIKIDSMLQINTIILFLHEHDILVKIRESDILSNTKDSVRVGPLVSENKKLIDELLTDIKQHVNRLY